MATLAVARYKFELLLTFRHLSTSDQYNSFHGVSAATSSPAGRTSSILATVSPA